MEEFAGLLKDIRLNEEDVPGTSLGCRLDGKPREPHELTVPELKQRWLVEVRDAVETKRNLSKGSDSCFSSLTFFEW